MKVQLTWKGSSAEVHPVLGRLEPGVPVVLDTPQEDVLASLRADTSGLYDIQVIDPPPAPVITRRGRGADSGEEGA